MNEPTEQKRQPHWDDNLPQTENKTPNPSHSLVGNIIRVDVERQGKNDIHAETHTTLEVIGLSILNKQSNHQARNKESNGLESLEVQRHLDTHDPAENNQEGSDKQRNLQAATNSNTDRKIHLILVRNDNGSNMFGGITHNRDQN